MSWWLWALLALGAVLVLTVIHDVVQRRHTILRVFPVIGHLRFLLEAVGPELRQYIVTDNDSERPFSRDQRRWVYSTAEDENSYFGFGTDNDLDVTPNYVIIKHNPFPIIEPMKGSAEFDPLARVPAAKVLGAARGRRHAFRPDSVVNVSGMSFGSLSGAAVEALNRGAALAGCLQSTGEGGVSRHHLHGGELVWQIGTGYFGCRDDQGRFDLARFVDVCASHPMLRAVEIKLSQGAKPGLGGLLPGAKVSPEIAAMRGVRVGMDCVSPARHTAFDDVDSMLDFVEALADASGLPVGIKSAVGVLAFWEELGDAMAAGERGVDFVVVDGGEGGTGAAPLAFSDHVSLPFKVGFSRAYRALAERGVHERVMWVGSGKLGFPEASLLAFSLGCDMVNVGREAMLSIGCIQAQRCHTGRCPTGVTTHSPWRERGLDAASKSVRCGTYLVGLRRELLALSRACGVVHPALVTPDHVEMLDGHLHSTGVRELFDYEAGWGVPDGEDRAEIASLMAPRVPHGPVADIV